MSSNVEHVSKTVKEILESAEWEFTIYVNGEVHVETGKDPVEALGKLMERLGKDYLFGRVVIC